MRLWSIHPKYLDSKGLVALWRETLLAQNVLLGNTVGYKNHPQLNRFKATANPVGAIASYLLGIEDEAKARNYNFNGTKINPQRLESSIAVTSGQVIYERSHLERKLEVRDPPRLQLLYAHSEMALHPLFHQVEGEIESWEII